MWNLLKNLMAPKAAVRLMLRGNLSQEAGLKLQDIVQPAGMSGWMRIVRGSHAQMELEGPKSKIEALLARLQHSPFTSMPTVLEITWIPYKGELTSFRVSV